MLYPQNGDRIMTIDSVTLLHIVLTSSSVWPVTVNILSALLADFVQRRFINIVCIVM